MSMPARLQPLSIGDLFDAAFRIYRRPFSALRRLWQSVTDSAAYLALASALIMLL
ncbi:MAG: hypothetical protein ABI901_06635 [Roseiflexaceae bacterium]